MNNTFLKIGIIVLPIIIMWLSGWAYVSVSILLHPPVLSMMMEEGGMTFSRSNQLPYLGSYVVLGLSIYLSIKLWIKYIHYDKI
ncbi:MAG: hypothetical protein ACW9W4_07900 [Candidatus Nitrosopumilus sp. bin_7KS]